MVAKAPERRFRRLYDEHHRAILSYFLRRTDRDSAYEATEDVYVIAWRKLESIPDGEMELAWLYTVARNVLANHRRKAVRFSRLVGQVRSRRPDPPPEPDHLVIMGSEHRAVLDALGELSDGDQEVLRLAVWEELPHAEIGEILGCSPGAVAMRVNRATQRLAKVYDRTTRAPAGRPVPLPGEER